MTDLFVPAQLPPLRFYRSQGRSSRAALKERDNTVGDERRVHRNRKCAQLGCRLGGQTADDDNIRDRHSGDRQWHAAR